MRLFSIAIAAMMATAILPPGIAHADVFTTALEAPGIQRTTMALDNSGVETFDTRALVTQTFTMDLGTHGAIAATFANVDIVAADQYGGAGGTGRYASDYTGTFSVSFAPSVSYVGLWISALNATNALNFFKNGTLVGTFGAADLTTLIAGNWAYKGNPNSQFLGNNYGEYYAFVNFRDTTGTFDTMTVSGSGYELDNLTLDLGVSTLAVSSSNVPEPATAGLLGIGLLGLGYWRRRTA